MRTAGCSMGGPCGRSSRTRSTPANDGGTGPSATTTRPGWAAPGAGRACAPRGAPGEGARTTSRWRATPWSPSSVRPTSAGVREHRPRGAFAARAPPRGPPAGASARGRRRGPPRRAPRGSPSGAPAGEQPAGLQVERDREPPALLAHLGPPPAARHRVGGARLQRVGQRLRLAAPPRRERQRGERHRGLPGGAFGVGVLPGAAVARAHVEPAHGRAGGIERPHPQAARRALLAGPAAGAAPPEPQRHARPEHGRPQEHEPQEQREQPASGASGARDGRGGRARARREPTRGGRQPRDSRRVGAQQQEASSVSRLSAVAPSRPCRRQRRASSRSVPPSSAGRSAAPERARQQHVLHQRHVGVAADRLVERAPHQHALVAVGQPEPARADLGDRAHQAAAGRRRPPPRVRTTPQGCVPRRAKPSTRPSVPGSTCASAWTVQSQRPRAAAAAARSCVPRPRGAASTRAPGRGSARAASAQPSADAAVRHHELGVRSGGAHLGVRAPPAARAGAASRRAPARAPRPAAARPRGRRPRPRPSAAGGRRAGALPRAPARA